jgi:sigma-B regulation protein RsbU (phosphoserine phosphatase)
VENSDNINKSRSIREQLEHKLSLQQLQINRLLEITQAINNNIKIADLFRIYKDTLTWELRIKKFALYTRFDENWTCVAHAGIEESLLRHSIDEYLPQFQRPGKVEQNEHELLSAFSIVIPVYHKKYPIAFTFIGENLIDTEDDVYEPIRFVAAITNIIAVAIENKRLFKKQLEQERLKRELELAVQVQNMLIPGVLPHTSEFEFDGVYHPHEGVGGDYYDFIELGENEMAFCIADISGKGIAAALLMSNFQASLHSLINRKYLSVIEFATLLNERVLKTTKGDKFITFFIARYHKKKKRLRYINCGHNPPIMMMQNKVFRLDKGCTVLGAFKKLPNIEWGEIQMTDDAFFLLYTDGLTDLKNESGDYFDENRVIDFVLENESLPVKDFNKLLLERLDVFKGDLGFPDDISFLSGKIFAEADILSN